MKAAHGKDNGFIKKEEIHLSNGAVIVPLLKKRKYYESVEMKDYLEENRWIRCKFQSLCINNAIKYDGFSCERCPLSGKAENSIEDDDFDCLKILTALAKSVASNS